MTTSIPSVSDLAGALVSNAGANPDDSMLLAGLIVDEAQRAASLGIPRPMVDHVEAAKLAYPSMFSRPKPTPTASASTPPKSITERLRQGENISFDEVSDAIRRMRKANIG